MKNTTVNSAQRKANIYGHLSFFFAVVAKWKIHNFFEFVSLTLLRTHLPSMKITLFHFFRFIYLFTSMLSPVFFLRLTLFMGSKMRQSVSSVHFSPKK